MTYWHEAQVQGQYLMQNLTNNLIADGYVKAGESGTPNAVGWAMALKSPITHNGSYWYICFHYFGDYRIDIYSAKNADANGNPTEAYILQPINIYSGATQICQYFFRVIDNGFILLVDPMGQSAGNRTGIFTGFPNDADIFGADNGSGGNEEGLNGLLSLALTNGTTQRLYGKDSSGAWGSYRDIKIHCGNCYVDAYGGYSYVVWSDSMGGQKTFWDMYITKYTFYNTYARLTDVFFFPFSQSEHLLEITDENTGNKYICFQMSGYVGSDDRWSFILLKKTV